MRQVSTKILISIIIIVSGIHHDIDGYYYICVRCQVSNIVLMSIVIFVSGIHHPGCCSTPPAPPCCSSGVWPGQGGSWGQTGCQVCRVGQGRVWLEERKGFRIQSLERQGSKTRLNFMPFLRKEKIIQFAFVITFHYHEGTTGSCPYYT